MKFFAVFIVSGLSLVMAGCGVSRSSSLDASRSQLLRQKMSVVPHLELEMESSEYSSLQPLELKSGERPDQMDDIVRFGGRLLAWVAFLNSHRPSPLELTSAESQVAYPIEAPRFANIAITEQIWTELVGRLPPIMKSVVIDGAEFSDISGISEAQFILYAREINMAYQRASRWLLQEPNLDAYAMFRAFDIRGFYYLGKLENIEASLKTHWGQNPDAEVLRGHLVTMCANSFIKRSQCKSELAAVELETKEVLSFYQKYLPGSKENWDSFFEMDNPRRDVTWADSEMSIPFKSPGNLTIQNWLTLNIQDEWKIKGWQLKLAFTDSPAGNPSTTRVEFVAGTTPHVNGIGGSVITMDANLPLEEYNSRWTIRHEYGHVLGFPDCYAEFYDEDLGQMISYQLDVSNLMCSRRGHLQYQHYERLKATYSSKN